MQLAHQVATKLPPPKPGVTIPALHLVTDAVQRPQPPPVDEVESAKPKPKKLRGKAKARAKEKAKAERRRRSVVVAKAVVQSKDGAAAVVEPQVTPDTTPSTDGVGTEWSGHDTGIPELQRYDMWLRIRSPKATVLTRGTKHVELDDGSKLVVAKRLPYVGKHHLPKAVLINPNAERAVTGVNIIDREVYEERLAKSNLQRKIDRPQDIFAARNDSVLLYVSGQLRKQEAVAADADKYVTELYAARSRAAIQPFEHDMLEKSHDRAVIRKDLTRDVTPTQVELLEQHILDSKKQQATAEQTVVTESVGQREHGDDDYFTLSEAAYLSEATSEAWYYNKRLAELTAAFTSATQCPATGVMWPQHVNHIRIAEMCERVGYRDAVTKYHGLMQDLRTGYMMYADAGKFTANHIGDLYVVSHNCPRNVAARALTQRGYLRRGRLAALKAKRITPVEQGSLSYGKWIKQFDNTGVKETAPLGELTIVRAAKHVDDSLMINAIAKQHNKERHLFLANTATEYEGVKYQAVNDTGILLPMDDGFQFDLFGMEA